jgi:hypothetical protein
MVGTRHGDRYYPAFSGVARSYNFYPAGPQKSSDGVVSVALGLGKMIVEGGATARFSPVYPNHMPQFSTVQEALRNNQRDFYALSLTLDPMMNGGASDQQVQRYETRIAEEDGVLNFVGSTYSPENDRIYDGIAREGQRLVTFAPILKSKIFPLPEIIELLLDMGSWGMGTPVEIEFAVDLCRKPHEFGLLQLRPFVLNRELEELDLGDVPRDQLICQSDQVLGHGAVKNIYDIVLVNRDAFNRAKSLEAAREIGQLNAALLAEKRPYLLMAVGRLGSLDPWLGIPVTWDQISGARAIVEANFKDFSVAPSQGSHFFHNLTSFSVGYFSINSENQHNFIDWSWLLSQQPMKSLDFVRHVRLPNAVIVKMNGQQNRGYVLKPTGAQHG